ncbi:MAG: SAV_2336 N-terminal domain-related protein [Vicinamibacterales bacterium]
MSDRLAALLRSLQSAGLELDAESVLDAAWLGLQMARQAAPLRGDAPRPQAAGSTPPDPAGGVPADVPLSAPFAGARAGESDTARAMATPSRGAQPSRASAQGRGVRLTRAPALPDSRELVRALRPLRRRVRSPARGVIDVESTVRRAADEDLWIPSFAPARERWLDVLLVADHGLSMVIWRETIDEFERVLRTSGAFRRVRSWWLESDTAAPALTARGRGQAPAVPERLPRLAQGLDRSVVLLMSDCVGARWHDGAIPTLVDGWSRQLPVALIQVTPEWFWARTALGDTVPSRFRSTRAAAANTHLRWDSSGLGSLAHDDDGAWLRLPAATLTAGAMARVASLIAGAGREWTPGVVFDLTLAADDAAAAPAAEPAERFARFTALASPPARRLASAFAASPIRTLGVLRLLRRDLLDEPRPFVEAEVLLGGIVRVRREDARWDMGASLPLEFVPGVDALLLDNALAGDVLRVLELAARDAREGVGPVFTSSLENPGAGAGRLDPSSSAFAGLAADVLSRLGGDHARIVGTASSTVGNQGDTTTSARVTPASAWTGGPHALPTPDPLVGRDREAEQLDAWVAAPGTQPALVITGWEGIGKTALAGAAITRFRNLHGRASFTWYFEQRADADAARRSLAAFVAGAATQEAPDLRLTREEIVDARAARPMPRLVTLDALDRAPDSDALAALLEDIQLVQQAPMARVLITVRRSEHVPALSGARLLHLIGLFPHDVERLVRERMRILETGARERGAGGDLRAAVELAQYAAGNPASIDRLTLAAFMHTVPVVIEELQLRASPTAEALESPTTLDKVLARVDRARLLEGLADEDRSRDRAAARESLNEAVSLRGSLPSRLYRGRALFRRGLLHHVTGDRDGAAADLADAVGLFRLVQSTPDLVEALATLGAARAAAGRYGDALDQLEEARRIAESMGDLAAAARVVLQTAAIAVDEGDPKRAQPAIDAALGLAERVEDVNLLGLAWMQQARLWLRADNREAALDAAQRAERLAESSGNAGTQAAVLDVIASVYEAAGHLDEARAALERLRSQQPDRASEVEDRLARLAAASNESNAPPDAAGAGQVTEVFEVSGRVSGVGFRLFAQQQARELGLAGSAENLPDGRIRVEATGDPDRLRDLEARLRAGPPGARVADVIVRRDDSGTPESSDAVGENTQAAPAVIVALAARERALVAIGVDDYVGLPALGAAAGAATDLAEWAVQWKQIPDRQVYRLTNADASAAALSGLGRSIVAEGRPRQLIVYFAGYSAAVQDRVSLLLPNALRDWSDTIDVQDLQFLGRRSSIEHVIVITDTVRVDPAVTARIPTSPSGTSIFPALTGARPTGLVDRFSFEAPPAGAGDRVSPGFDGAFTALMLDAMRGLQAHLFTLDGGTGYLTTRALADFLLEQGPEGFARAGVPTQRPVIRIESGPGTWIATLSSPS